MAHGGVLILLKAHNDYLWMHEGDFIMFTHCNVWAIEFEYFHD